MLRPEGSAVRREADIASPVFDTSVGPYADIACLEGERMQSRAAPETGASSPATRVPSRMEMARILKETDISSDQRACAMLEVYSHTGQIEVL